MYSIYNYIKYKWKENKMKVKDVVKFVEVAHKKQMPKDVK